MSEEKTVSVKEYLRNVEDTQEKLNNLGKVVLKRHFFDKVIHTTPKAILIAKGGKTAWVARKVIAEIEISKDDVSDLWVPEWVTVDWG